MEAYQKLEEAWAKFNDLDPQGMVACSSGTAALHLALESMQLPPGSQVIVPDFTMIAVPRAVTLAGLEPVFVDCDHTLNMDAKLIPSGDTRETRGCNFLLAVHTYGRQVNLDAIHASRILDLVIEDLAEAHGVRPNQFTNAACWSFYRNKIVHGEEGGAVWFKDPKHARLARQLRCLGFTDAHNFVHVPRGHNYRMSNLHAEPILKSIKRFDLAVAARRVSEYVLNDYCPAEWQANELTAPWVYDFRIPGMTSEEQDKVIRALQASGIPARHAFKPCSHQLEYLKHRRVDCGKHYAHVASREVVYIPLDRAYTSDPFDAVRAALS